MIFFASQHSRLHEHDIIIACKIMFGTHIPIPTKSAKLKKRQNRFSWLKWDFLLFWKEVKLGLYLIWEIRLYETFRNLAIVSFDEFPHRCKKSWALIGSAPQGIIEYASIWKLGLFRSPFGLSCFDWTIRLDLRDLRRFISLIVTYLQVLHLLKKLEKLVPPASTYFFVRRASDQCCP